MILKKRHYISITIVVIMILMLEILIHYNIGADRENENKYNKIDTGYGKIYIPELKDAIGITSIIIIFHLINSYLTKKYL